MTNQSQNNSLLRIYRPIDSEKAIEIVKEKQQAENLNLALRLVSEMPSEVKIVPRIEIIGVYRKVFEMFFESIKANSDLLSTLGISTQSEPTFTEEIFKKLLRATFQTDLDSEKENTWKADKSTQITLRYAVDLIIYCCEHFNTKTVEEFLNSLVENSTDSKPSFTDILNAINNQYSFNNKKDKLEFTKLPVYIEEKREKITVTDSENQNSTSAEWMPVELEVLFTKDVPRSKNNVDDRQTLALILRLYEEGTRPNANKGEGKEDNKKDPKKYSTGPESSFLPIEKPTNILCEKIKKIEAIFEKADQGVANMLRQIGSPEFINFLDETLFADNRLHFLANDETSQKLLQKLISNFTILTSKQEITGKSNLIDGIFALILVLPDLDIFCRQALGLNDKGELINQNSWVQDMSQINNINTLIGATKGVLLNLYQQEDAEPLKDLLKKYLGLEINPTRVTKPKKEPRGFATKKENKREKPVNYQAGIDDLKNFLTEFSDLDKIGEQIRENIGKRLRDLSKLINAINQINLLHLCVYNDLGKVEKRDDLMPINFDLVARTFIDEPTELTKILDIQNKYPYLFESHELLYKLGMSELQPQLEKIKEVVEKTKEIYENSFITSVPVESAVELRITRKMTLRLLEALIKYSEIFSQFKPYAAFTSKDKSNPTYLPLEVIGKIQITNAEKYRD